MKQLLAFLLTLSLSSASAMPILKTPRTSITRLDSVKVDNDRLILLNDDIADNLINPAIEQLRELDETKAPIYIIISSNGGFVSSGENMIRAMEAAQSPFVCIVEGKAYSMAAIIATYCQELYIHKFAMIMFHEVGTEMSGTLKRLQTNVKRLENVEQALFEDVAKNLDMPYEEFIQKCRDEWWIPAREATSLGITKAIVDKVVYKAPKTNILFNLIFDFFSSR